METRLELWGRGKAAEMESELAGRGRARTEKEASEHASSWESPSDRRILK